MRLFVLVCLALALPLRADSLGELKTRLTGLRSQSPVKASIDRQIWIRQGDPKAKAIQGSAQVWAEDSPQGLKLFWNRAPLTRAVEESIAHEDTPGASPLVEALNSLGPVGIEGYFNAVPRLLQDLSKARLVEERPDSVEGKPARLLRFSLEADPELKKVFNKEAACTLSIWLDAEGWPVLRKFKRAGKGRLMMVASVEAETSDEYRYLRMGDRLVITSHRHEDRASGSVGQPRESRQTTTLNYQ